MPRRLTVQIDLANDSFHPPGRAVSRMLREVIDAMNDSCYYDAIDFPLRDANGNKVGRAWVR